ncbi:MAG TPA: hypothetical protein VNO70_18950 [Blastocatellia bacterium]|nr:hypothetical protein [Blastocatellia bacterium]
MANQRSSSRSGEYPLNNLAFDIITIIYEKSKALEAYEKYLKDAQNDEQVRQLFETARDQDRECVAQLQQHLGRLLGQPGGAAQQGTSAATTGTGAKK